MDVIPGRRMTLAWWMRGVRSADIPPKSNRSEPVAFAEDQGSHALDLDGNSRSKLMLSEVDDLIKTAVRASKAKAEGHETSDVLAGAGQRERSRRSDMADVPAQG